MRASTASLDGAVEVRADGESQLRDRAGPSSSTSSDVQHRQQRHSSAGRAVLQRNGTSRDARDALKDLRGTLKDKRRRRGSIDFTEIKVKLGEGTSHRARQTRGRIAENIIEHCSRRMRRSARMDTQPLTASTVTDR